MSEVASATASQPMPFCTPGNDSPETWGYQGGPSGADGARTRLDAGKISGPVGPFPLPDNGGSNDATRIDGSAQNSGERTTKQTTDGKTVAVDPFQRDGDVTIERERTLVDMQGQQYVSDDQLVFTTGSADDDVQVTNNDDGTLGVSINGQSYDVEMADGQQLTFRTGDGNDAITVASDVKVNVVIDSGDGDDTIQTGAGDATIFAGDGDDTISTGSGNNYVEAGNGDDVVNGGSGYNVIYGGDGNDQLNGGDGGNYISGGKGADQIVGGTGEDILSGGRGDDRIQSNGTSHVYAGSGNDVISGSSLDTIYAEKADDVSGADGAKVVNVVIDPSLGTKGVSVEGTEGFQQRVNADLDMLRSSPYGQQMLAEFDKAAENGNTLTIRELQNESNGYTMPKEGGNNWADTQLNNGRAGRGDDAVIAYNTSFRIPEFPVPVGVLYHEMSHAYNAVTGTFQPGTYYGDDAKDSGSVPNSERQAVGLDNSGQPYDFDHDSSTPPTTHNPFPLTENGLREEMGLDPRLHYTL